MDMNGKSSTLNSTLKYVLINISLFTKWCSHCEKVKREERNQILKEEAKKEKERYTEEQNAKLEEAKQQVLKEEQESRNYETIFNNWPRFFFSSGFYLNDDSINQLAKDEALKYMATASYDGTISYEDICFMHKILITPAQLLIAKLYSLYLNIPSLGV